MLAVQGHRGPDGHGSCIVGNISLGGNRLAIVDVNAEATVPMRGERWVLSFNGEIYNAPEIRKTLEKRGHMFRTKTDTEVVLQAWEEWQTDCLDLFDGMFAFAITDGRTLYLVRDPAGEKPLAYHVQKNRVCFASEAKAVWEIVQTSECPDTFFETFEYCLERTLWSGIKNVLPGHYIAINLHTHAITSTRRYWSPKTVDIDRKYPDEQLEELLKKAVFSRIPSEVGYTLYYSGGIDSELLRTFLPADTRLIHFDETERRHEQEFLSVLPDIVRHLDTPVGSFSPYGLWDLGHQTKKHGAKVALSGEGADELFGGYARTVIFNRVWELHKDMSEYAPLLSKTFGEKWELYSALTQRSTERIQEIQERLKECIAEEPRNTLNWLCLFEFRYLLPMLLQMGDRMAMAHGVENRCPFLAKDILNFAFSLQDDAYRIQGVNGKIILRTILARRNPKAKALTASKKGLYVPVNTYINAPTQYDRRAWLDYQLALWRQQFPSY